MKNILLTTLGYTKDLIDMRYFHYENAIGEKCFCSGISAAEAGTKYFLSSYQIDEIVVLGAQNAVKEVNADMPVPILDFDIAGRTSLSDFSEYSFYCYRIQQFLNDLDIEGNDIFESVSPEEQEDIGAAFRQLRESIFKGVNQKNLFYVLNESEALPDELSTIRQTFTSKQWNRLIYSLYSKMDSFRKMHALNMNRNLTVRFFTLENDSRNSFRTQQFEELISFILREAKDRVALYLDLQGLDFTDAFTLFNLISVVKNSKASIEGIIESTVQTNRLSSPIIDQLERLGIQELRTGVSIFAKYGKSDYLRSHLGKTAVRGPMLERLLMGMQYVEEGISLCNIPMVKYGLDAIRQLFTEHKPETSGELEYRVLALNLRQEYGGLLSGKELSIAELLRWAIKNQMYQQALTILESQIPADMVKNGIYYYARTEEDVKRLKEELNIRYWNEMPKNRYIFRDICHYFVKLYGRNKLNYHQKPAMVTREFAKIKILALKEETELLPAYSDLNNNDMLYKLLLCYYTTCDLRNNVCHAEPPKACVEGGAEMVPTSNLDILDSALTRFVNLYSAALNRVSKNDPQPLISDDQIFQQYFSDHRLRPFTKLDDNTMEESCIVNYNGKEISVVVRMLEPMEDVQQ